jgi:hypothetical protein
MKLKAISNPFNAGKFVELKFIIPECGEVTGGGMLTLCVSPEDAKLYMLGDKYYVHLRSL